MPRDRKPWLSPKEELTYRFVTEDMNMDKIDMAHSKKERKINARMLVDAACDALHNNLSEESRELVVYFLTVE